MRILIYGINYAPELTGIGKYTGEFGAFLSERGDEVEVIAAPPYYPAWAIRAPYANTWLRERVDGVTVMRSPLYVPAEQSGLKRILHEVAFVASSLRWWVPRLFRRYDAIVAVSPPFHLGALPLLHRLLHGTPVVNHIQDLQVDAARDLGLLSSEGLLRALETVERWLLRRMSRVSTISAGMLRKVLDKGVDPEDTWMVPNWVDRQLVYPLPPERSLRARFGIGPGTPVVLYAGNLGQKQGLDVVPRVAAGFAERRPEVLFLIVGEGGARAELEAEVRRRGLRNVRFEGLQPLEDLAAMLAVGDVHLVLQKRAAADLVMPSKLTNIVAVGGHAVVTAEPGTTLYDVVAAERIGTLVPPEDEAALAAGIERVLSGGAAADVTGLAAFAKTLDRDAILAEFRTRLADLSEGSTRG